MFKKDLFKDYFSLILQHCVNKNYSQYKNSSFGVRHKHRRLRGSEQMERLTAEPQTEESTFRLRICGLELPLYMMHCTFTSLDIWTVGFYSEGYQEHIILHSTFSCNINLYIQSIYVDVHYVSSHPWTHKCSLFMHIVS